jgi:hypothetical protein
MPTKLVPVVYREKSRQRVWWAHFPLLHYRSGRAVSTSRSGPAPGQLFSLAPCCMGGRVLGQISCDCLINPKLRAHPWSCMISSPQSGDSPRTTRFAHSNTAGVISRPGPDKGYDGCETTRKITRSTSRHHGQPLSSS